MKSTYTSFDLFVPNTLDPSKPQSPLEGEDEDGFVLVKSPTHDKSMPPASPFFTPPKFNNPKVSTTPSPRISTLRRKNAELFGSSKSSFDAEDEEEHEQSPSLRPSTLRCKTGEMFGSRYSSNPFDPEDSELDELSSRLTVRSRPLPSLSTRISPTRRAEAAVSLVSAETDLGHALPEKTSAAEALSKQHLAAPMSSPGLSTLKRRSADLFARKGYFSSSAWDDEDDDDESTQRQAIPPAALVSSPGLSTLKRRSADLFAREGNSASSAWDEDEDESTQRFKSVQLDPTQRGRGLTFKSSHKSQSPPSTCASSAIIGTEDQDYDESQIMSRSKAKYRSWSDKKDLDVNIQNFAANRGTFKGRMHSSEVSSQSFGSSPNASVSSSMVENALNTISPIRGANMTEQEHDDFLHELLDKECGNPNGLDAHDEVMQQFYRRNNDSLPVSNPAGFPHLIDYLNYTTDTDPIVQNARPRLTDAVATTLFQTSHQCLTDFLNPEVQVFEWCRSKQHIMIRREGKYVIVGTYQNYGTCYVWNYFVQSQISETGAWKEVYAGASQVITPVSAKGIEFDKLMPGESIQGVDPMDEKYALHIGRALGQFMLLWQVWGFTGAYLIEWQANGVVRNAREVLYEDLRMAREETEEN